MHQFSFQIALIQSGQAKLLPGLSRLDEQGWQLLHFSSRGGKVSALFDKGSPADDEDNSPAGLQANP
jgi:hypothetical protein